MTEVLGDTPDSRRVAAPVVVEDDHHLGLELADVIERLVCHPAGERTVTDDADDLAAFAGELTRCGKGERVAEARRRVRVLDEVVLGFLARGIATHAALLTQRLELFDAAGQHLVDIRLVAGVEDDRVARALEHPVHRNGQLDHTEVRAEMAAGPRHGGDQDIPYLGAETGQVFGAEIAQIRGSADLLEQHKISLVEPSSLGSLSGNAHTQRWRSMITGHAGTGASRGGTRMCRARRRYRRGSAVAGCRRLPRR